MDVIFISELKLEALVGIYPWERKVPQTIQLDLEIGANTTRAATSGKIADTIDYAKVVGRIREMIDGRHFRLLEQLAEDLATMVIGEFGAGWVQLSIAKLAPLPGVKRLGVRIERGARPK